MEEDLEFRGINKDLKVIESNITIYNSIFENDLDFSNLLFKKSLSLVEVNFSSSTYFLSTSFGDGANFERASFGGFADFRRASFGGNAGFYDASFDGDVDFEGASFGGYAGFYDASFGGDADFEGASFDGDVDFEGASFDGDADFEGASFGGFADFEGASFGGYAGFYGVSGGYIFFEGANFSNVSSFDRANFDNTVDFSGTQFKEVTLNGTNFEEMRVSWDSLENSLVFDGSAYVKLIKNFRDLEQFEDADAAYFQYRKFCQAEKSWIPFSNGGSKWWDLLMCFTCGYGVKPFRAFGLGGFIVLLFSLIYLGSPSLSWRNVGDVDSAQKSATKLLLNLIPKIDWPNPGISRLSDNKDFIQKVTFWDSFYFSVVTFSTIGFGDWYPKDSFRKWVMLEGLFGWITLSLFLVTLTNVMIRP